MADDYTPLTEEDVVNAKNAGIMDTLRGMGNRFKQQVGGYGREVLANMHDLGRLPVALGLPDPEARSAAGQQDADQAAYQRIISGEAPPQASLDQAPLAVHSSDPGVRVAGQVFDPTMLIGGGAALGTKAVGKVAPKIAAALEDVVAPVVRKRAGALVNLPLREMPEQDALAAALAGKHLVPLPEGGYVGAPLNIKNMDDLLANRARMDADYVRNEKDIIDAGGIPGDWYPSQRRGVREIAEPYQQSRVARLRGLTSNDASPESETAFTMQGWNRMARGEKPGNIKYGRQGDELAAATAEGRPIKLGLKTEGYGTAGDPTAPRPLNELLTGANDFREARVQGYTHPSGEPWDAGLSQQQHTFMDAERMLAVQRARDRELAARVGEEPQSYGERDIFKAPEQMTGEKFQEVNWIGNKADALQANNPTRFPPTPEGRRAAIQEAMKSGQQYQMKHAVGATYEHVPGRNLGHVPEIADASTAEKQAYGAAAPWTDEAGRDEIYKSLGLLQRPTEQGFGIWEGKTNPNYIAQPLADFKPGGILPKGMQRQLSLGEHLRGLGNVQDASAFHIPATMSGRTGKTHLLMPHEGALSEQEMQDLAGKLPPGWSPTPTPRGTMLMNFGEGNPAKESAQIAQTLDRPVERAGMESNLIDVYGGKPPGEGRATSAFLRRAVKSPQREVQALGESEGVRGVLENLHARDALLGEQGSQVSAPAQATRRFLAEADWPKAVDMMRKGATPEEAVAAIGPYRLKEMGYTKTQMAALLAGLTGGGLLISKALRSRKPAAPAAAAPGGRTTADAFQQRQDDMDAANAELQRQNQPRGFEQQNKSRLDRQIEQAGG